MILFCFVFFLLLLKVLGNSGWPRYLSSCSSWLHILFAWLFLWRVFTKNYWNYSLCEPGAARIRYWTKCFRFDLCTDFDLDWYPVLTSAAWYPDDSIFNSIFCEKGQSDEELPAPSQSLENCSNDDILPVPALLSFLPWSPVCHWSHCLEVKTFRRMWSFQGLVFYVCCSLWVDTNTGKLHCLEMGSVDLP